MKKQLRLLPCVVDKERFIIVPDMLVDENKMIILSDYNFWAEHEQELDDWCAKNNCSRTGMMVVAFDDVALTAFCLKWL